MYKAYNSATPAIVSLIGACSTNSCAIKPHQHPGQSIGWRKETGAKQGYWIERSCVYRMNFWWKKVKNHFSWPFLRRILDLQRFYSLTFWGAAATFRSLSVFGRSCLPMWASWEGGFLWALGLNDGLIFQSVWQIWASGLAWYQVWLRYVHTLLSRRWSDTKAETTFPEQTIHLPQKAESFQPWAQCLSEGKHFPTWVRRAIRWALQAQTI